MVLAFTECSDAIIRTCALMERRSRCLSRRRTARYQPKSRCPEICGDVLWHRQCAGQPLRSPAQTRRGRRGHPTAPGNRRRNIHCQSRVGPGLLRERTACFHNGPGWSAPPRSSSHRTAQQLQTEWTRLRKRLSERRRRCDCRSWESSIMALAGHPSI